MLFRDGFVEVSLYLLKAFPRAFWGWPVAIIFGKPANSSPILLFSWWLIPPPAGSHSQMPPTDPSWDELT